MSTKTKTTQDAKALIRREDDTLRPELTRLSPGLTEHQAQALVTPARDGDSLQIGDIAYVHGTGRLRRGIVVKTTKQKVTIAYTTPSSEGRIFRMAVDRKQALVDPEPRQAQTKLAAEEQAAPEKAPTAAAQAETQAEAPKAEKAAKKAVPATAGRRSIPEKAANKTRQAYVAEVGMAKYRNQYNAGWDAATAGQGAKKAASGEAPVAWMDGYTDRVANPGKEGIANKWAALRATTAPVKKVDAPKEG